MGRFIYYDVNCNMLEKLTVFKENLGDLKMRRVRGEDET